MLETDDAEYWRAWREACAEVQAIERAAGLRLPPILPPPAPMKTIRV